MQYHLVLVSSARPVGEIPRLVCAHGHLGFIHIYEDIAFSPMREARYLDVGIWWSACPGVDCECGPYGSPMIL